MSATRREFTITCVRLDEQSAWTAHVSTDGRTYKATRRHGSWSLLDGHSEIEALPHIAAALQDRVRPLEKRGEVLA